MRKHNYPTNVLGQAQEVVQAWNQIGPNQTLGNIAFPALNADLAAANVLMADVVKMETQLNDKRNQRDAALESIWDKVKRVRASVKGGYGDDSYQYKLVGGTRLSEKKPPTRKASA